MYFIKYQPLKEKLKSRSLTDREALPYLLIFAGLTALVCALPLIDSFNRWDAVSAMLSVAAAMGGIIYAYYQNGGRAGYDLIQKCVVLGWVVSVRCALVFIPTAIALMAAGEAFGLLSYESTGWYDVVIVFVFEILLYQRIGRHLRDTRS